MEKKTLFHELGHYLSLDNKLIYLPQIVYICCNNKFDVNIVFYLFCILFVRNRIQKNSIVHGMAHKHNMIESELMHAT